MALYIASLGEKSCFLPRNWMEEGKFLSWVPSFLIGKTNRRKEEEVYRRNLLFSTIPFGLSARS
jgi:hypothetical protein